MTTNTEHNDLYRLDAPLKRGKRVFALLFFINLFNYIDRQVLYAVFPLIKSDLALSDTQLGLLASAFMIVYMMISPFTGYFGDRSRRQNWIAASAMLWSVATVACAGVKNYAHLLVARSFIGVGEAGFTTISPSFVAEHFPNRQRARVMALFTLALPFGSALGYLLGGHFGEQYGWRAAFLLVGVPGFFLGLAAFLLRDPNRGAQQKEPPPDFKRYKKLIKNKPFMYACLSQAMVTFTLGGFAAWMPSFFNRYYGYSVAEASMVFGAMTVVGGILGTFAGGWLADWLHKKTQRAYFIVIYGTIFAAVPFAVAALSMHGKVPALVCFLIAETLIFMHMGPINAALVDATSVAVRSMAFALNIFIIHVLGDAVSPTVIGAISDAAGLRMAIVACSLMLLLAGWFAVKGAQCLPAEPASS